MKKTVIVALACIFALSACSMEDSNTSNHTAYKLNNFETIVFNSSVKSAVETVMKSNSEELFLEGFCDTLWSSCGQLDLIISKVAGIDSCWTVKAQNNGYNFCSTIKMLDHIEVLFNDFCVRTNGTYTEGLYSANFQTVDDVTFKWNGTSSYNGIQYTIEAQAYGVFNIITYLEGERLDENTQTYNGDNMTFTGNLGSGESKIW